MNIADFIKENKNFDIAKWKASKKGIVYFICEENGLIVYIGSTKNPVPRFTTHSYRKEFSNKPIFFFSPTKNKCKKLEQKLINQIKPKYNINHIHKPKKKQYIRIKDRPPTSMNYILFRAIKEAGLRAYQIAKIAGIESSRFSRILSGERKIKSEEKRILSKILKIPQKDLF
jgi:predicted GIY-YIG superfamily endonuclease